MPDSIQFLMEEQHPLVRANVKLSAGLLAFVTLLHVVVLVGVRIVETRYMFEMNTFLRLFQTLLVLLLVMMGYNALKVTVQYMRGRDIFTIQAVVLVGLSVLLVALSIAFLPSVFKRAVAFSAGRSYTHVYDEFQAACSRWADEYADSSSISDLDLAAEDLGSIAAEAEIYKLQSTVFFNFGGDDYEFGFACALRNQEPATGGRARDYNYRQIKLAQYEFVKVVE